MTRLGTLRRSQILTTFGPGALADYRVGGHSSGTVSAVLMGLDAWDVRHCRALSEPALQRLLGVTALREPPVSISTIRDGERQDGPALKAVRFPRWLECPHCHALRPLLRWHIRPGAAVPACRRCSKDEPVAPVPARLLMSCANGHLDEFPWDDYLDHKPDCPRRENLAVNASGAGLRGLFLNCLDCAVGRSLGNALSGNPIPGRLCSGARPWLGGDTHEPCHAQPRVLQRGVSNTYFAATVSALSIPPWTEELLDGDAADDWRRIMEEIDDPDGDDDELEREVRKAARRMSKRSGEPPTVSETQARDRLDALVRDYRALPATDDPNGEIELRKLEWRQFRLGDPERPQDRTFEVHNEEVPPDYAARFAAIGRVTRLREVRALKGFTRIDPPDGTS